MNVHQIIGLTAAVICSTAALPYFISIIKRETVLNRASWFVWLAVGGVTFSSYLVSGARATIFLPALYLVTNAIFFIMSLKYGEGGLSKFDLSCVAIAMFALLVWWITRRSDYANYVSLMAEFIGFLPTYKKIWQRPETESYLAWGIATFAQFLNLFAIEQRRAVIIVDPVSIFLDYFIVMLLLSRKYTLSGKKRRTTIAKKPLDSLS